MAVVRMDTVSVASPVMVVMSASMAIMRAVSITGIAGLTVTPMTAVPMIMINRPIRAVRRTDRLHHHRRCAYGRLHHDRRRAVGRLHDYRGRIGLNDNVARHRQSDLDVNPGLRGYCAAD